MISTTLIIPIYQEFDWAWRCLTSFRQHHQRCPVPILLVDDGNAAGALNEFENLSGVRILHQPHQGVTAAWNTAIAASRTEWVVLLNSDVLTYGTWLPLLLASVKGESGPAMAGCRWQNPRSARNQGFENGQLLEGWCLAFRSRWWQKLGGFDQRFRHWYSDTDFQRRMHILAQQHSDRSAASVLKCVDSLPLQHQGHASTHRLPDRSHLYAADKAAYFQKWTPVPASAELTGDAGEVACG